MAILGGPRENYLRTNCSASNTLSGPKETKWAYCVVGVVAI